MIAVVCPEVKSLILHLAVSQRGATHHYADNSIENKI